MAAIIFNCVDFHYDTPYNPIFQNLSLVLDTQWRSGLIGRNGRGKTTLLQLIHRQLQATSGTVDVHRPTIYFPAPVTESATVRQTMIDAIAPFRHWQAEMEQCLKDGSAKALERYADLQDSFQNAGGYELDANIERELDHIALDPGLLTRRFSTLSGGEQTRILIAALFVSDQHFPLIDEPTNHLDQAGRRHVADYLAEKNGFLLVSHDRQFLDGAIDHVIAINKSDIKVTAGAFSAWQADTASALLHEQRTRDNIEREVKQLSRASTQRRSSSQQRESDKYQHGKVGKGDAAVFDKGAIGHSAAKQMKRALAIERRINNQLDERRGLLKNQEKQRVLSIQTRDKTSRSLLIINNLELEINQAPIIRNLSLTLSSGDRIAITGPNGSGKTSLFNAICGELTPSGGSISQAAHIRFDRAFQHPLWSKGFLQAHIETAGIDETRFRQLLGTLEIRGDVFDRPLDTFSQGQLKKVDLCRTLVSEVDYLLWDEPMNYIDIFSREQIEQAILNSSPTLLFIEHDETFVNNVATEVIDLSPP
ncbi:MAG: lincosamide and streptogramin A transport system ATP-binding/permease protein [Candidatus Azotimanducaceae bacterium]|jgi:lincosamide and streptogramin A transport system ATP-binding/permease protein